MARDSSGSFPSSQGSFAGGELTPSLWGQKDARYAQSLRRCKNFMVSPHGAAISRPGTMLVAETKYSAPGSARLIPFVYSGNNAIVLEVGANPAGGGGYIRMQEKGAPVLVSGVPAYDGTSSYPVGALVSSGSVNYYCLALAVDNLNRPIPTPAPPSFAYWYALTGNIYEIPTPFIAADLFQLTHAQSGDVMNFAHPNYPPMELERTAATTWLLAPKQFAPVGPPLAPSAATVTPATGTGTAYGVCSSNAPAWSMSTKYAAGAYVTNAGGGGGTPVVFMSLADNNVGNSLPTMVGLSNAWWLYAMDTAHPTKAWSWVSTTVYRDDTGAVHESAAGNSSTDPHLIYTESAVCLFTDRPAAIQTSESPSLPVGATVLGRNVYRGRNGLFGLVGTLAVGTDVFNDDGSEPDYTTGAPVGTRPFQAQAAPQEWNSFAGYHNGNQVLWKEIVYTAQSTGNTLYPPDVDRFGFWRREDWRAGGTYAKGSWVNSVNYATSLTPPSTLYFALQASDASNFQDPTTSPTFWGKVFEYPATVCYFEQRLIFGGSGAQSASVAGSACQQLGNFDRSGVNTNPASPMNLTKATDSFLFTVAATKREEIRALVPLRSLLLMTSLNERSLRGAGGSALTNQSFDEKQQSAKGSTWLAPLVINNVVLFNQVQGSRVRDLVYNFYADSYSGRDISIQAEHLFRNHSLVDWAYASVPNAIAWCVRDDGLLLGLTYQDGPATDEEQDAKIAAWHQHQTQGDFKSVCALPEGTEDAVYFVAGRTIQGTYRTFIERMATRVLSDQRLFIATDCSLLFDGRNTTSTTMQLGGVFVGGTVTTLTASTAVFSNADIGRQIVLDPDGTAFPVDAFDSPAPVNTPWSRTTSYGAGAVVQYKGVVYFSLQTNNTGNAPNSMPPSNSSAPAWWALANGPFPCTVTEYTNAQNVNVLIERNIPSSFAASPSPAWGRAQANFVVPHLAGKVLSVVADGSPNSFTADASGNVILTDGTNPTPACVVSIGLGYSLELETLDLFSPGRDVRSNQKSVARVGLECELTAPFSVQLGATFGDPPDYAAFDPTLFVPFQQRKNSDPTGVPAKLFTGYDQQNIKDTFQPYGRAAVYCTDPVPVTIMTITRDASLGGSVS